MKISQKGTKPPEMKGTQTTRMKMAKMVQHQQNRQVATEINENQPTCEETTKMNEMSMTTVKLIETQEQWEEVMVPNKWKTAK